MPPINKYRCNHCGFSFPEGWGGYFYVEVDEDLLRRRLLEVEEQLSNLRMDLENVKIVLEEVERTILENINFIERSLNEMKPKIEDGFQKVQSTIEEIKCRRPRLQDAAQHFELKIVRLKEEIFGIKDRLTGEVKERVKSDFETYFWELMRSLKEEKGSLERQLQVLKDAWHNLKSENLRVMRVRCPHPSELDYATVFLGEEAYREHAKSRCGFNSYAICLDCLHEFEADFRDEKVNEWRFWYGFPSFKEAFRGKPIMKDERRCPKCGVGIIEEIETGIVA